MVIVGHTEKNIIQANGETIPSNLNGFLVTFSSPAGGVCQVGIIALKNDLLFRLECHVSNCDLMLAAGTC
jgi:hypothetical protein